MIELIEYFKFPPASEFMEYILNPHPWSSWSNILNPHRRLSSSSSSSIYFHYSINNQFEQKWMTKDKMYSYAKGYQKENNFIELATYKVDRIF